MSKTLKVLTEPVMLVLLLGIVLFVAYSWISGYIETKNKNIYVSDARIEMLKESFIKTWNRTPTKEETNNLIDKYVMDEVFFKEAVAMGLDKTDPSVKFRLRQVMEIMLDDLTTVYPTQNQLQKYLSENEDKFRKDSRISFIQLYFPFENKHEAIEFLAEIKKDKSKAEQFYGGLKMIPDNFTNNSKFEVERTFGIFFTEELFKSQTGEWLGPVESNYGWHLVYLNERTEGKVPDLNTIWDEVEREWSVQRKKEIKDEQYKILREQYLVEFEEKE